MVRLRNHRKPSIASAKQIAYCAKVDALTITDNPGGTPALSAEMLGAEIIRAGHGTTRPCHLQGQEP